MNINTLRAFFGWCTVINGIWLIVSWLVIRFVGPDVREWVNVWIPLSVEQFHLAICLLMGGFKLFVIGCNLTPYIALRLVQSRLPAA